MPDDKTNIGGQDRERVSADETYEVAYFSEKHGISLNEARRLIAEHGNSRKILDEAAEKFKAAK